MVKYECWNPRCQNYAAAGVSISNTETSQADVGRICGVCHAPVTPYLNSDISIAKAILCLFWVCVGALVGAFLCGTDGLFVGIASAMLIWFL